MPTPDRRQQHPRTDLLRTVSFTRSDDDDHGDGRTFTGYGAVFNSPTTIDSWEGCFQEQFVQGAFRKTIRERTPKFQFDHGRHPLIGSVPIGTITSITEDERGLLVEARLGKHTFIDFIQEALETEAIDGMSIRFSVIREEWRDRHGNLVPADEVDELLWTDDPERCPLMRTITEAKLDEVGPVVWPAYQDTTAGVRTTTGGPVTIYPDRLHEPEQRRLLAKLLLRAEAQEENITREGEPSDDEPQDTPPGDVEHSEEDTDAPQDADQVVEHEPESNPEDPAPTDRVDDVRAAEEELFFARALADIRRTQESTPPMKGL
ncbi:MAG TPA: HK97 family phage prohead protease [Gordonia sp. (in: high G+C Gram-positive bacteria)]|jgi:HK97 family phage prohead protease|nr:HK97 family phage prohead protease [Gordonia sp. (in: high G+C Gram-positive bacteria)]